MEDDEEAAIVLGVEERSVEEVDRLLRRLAHMGLQTIGEMYTAIVQRKLDHELEVFAADILFSSMMDDGVFDTLDLIRFVVEAREHGDVGKEEWFANYLRRHPMGSIPSRDN